MGNNTEIELKLQLASPEAWGDVLRDLESFKTGREDGLVKQTLEACYYDTARLSLKKARLAYRIRREQGQWIATVKGGGSSAGGLHKRQEWNEVVPEAVPAIEVFSALPVGKELKAATGEDELKLLFITRFIRHTLNVQREDSLIEIAADRGEIIVGEIREPILEIELELKEGNPSALLKLGAELAKKYPLILESRSKYFRGLQLAGLVNDDDFSKRKEISSPANLAAIITEVINDQAVLVKQPDKNENRIRLQQDIKSLVYTLESSRTEMDSVLYEYFTAGLLHWKEDIGSQGNQKAVDKGPELDAGQYTSLMLNLWAWTLDKNPADK